MPKVKIPRKSTNIDMTAMCDVAFLLLSFFILATKQKPPEPVPVVSPSSVSQEVAVDTAYLISFGSDGKTFLSISPKVYKLEILNQLNADRNLGLTEQEIALWNTTNDFGTPLEDVKNDLSSGKVPSNEKGLKIESNMNELQIWLSAIRKVCFNESLKPDNNDAVLKQNYMNWLQNKLLIKGDVSTKYPKYKLIKKALKENELFRFRLVTNKRDVPEGTPLAINPDELGKNKNGK